MNKTSPDSSKSPLSVSCRVLIVHPFGIGDVLFVTPVIRALKEKGVERIDLLLGSRTRELFENCPHVSHIYEWSKDKPKSWLGRFRYWLEIGKLFWRLAQGRYDVFLDFSLSREYAFFAKYLWGIPVRVGFNYKNRGIFLNYRQPLEAGFSDKPVVDYYFELLSFFGIAAVDKSLEFFLSDDDCRDAEAILSREGLSDGQTYLVVSPGGGESWGKDARFKRWPAEYFAELIKKIAGESGFQFAGILIVGSAKEFEIGENLRKMLNGFSVSNLCGKTKLRTSAALIEKALFVLANDGGMVHVSCALKTPVIAFYGPVDERVYGPYGNGLSLAIANYDLSCRPCYRRMRYRSDCPHVECLTSLTPERAYQEIQKNRFLERILAVKKN